jgi:hypothetical protein
VSDLVRHWNEIFAAKDDPQLGWYEADVAQTIRFLDRVPAVEAVTIFLPGATCCWPNLLPRGHPGAPDERSIGTRSRRWLDVWGRSLHWFRPRSSPS